MKYIIILSLFLTSCTSYIYDYVIIKSIQLNHANDYKYRVELQENHGTTYLYTNDLYQVGDTLFTK